MRAPCFFFFPILLVCPLAAASADTFVVHEWGTFTSVSGSDGSLLPGLECEELAVPPFVHSRAGFAPATKGLDRPVANVTIKMETPVLYFYSDHERTVAVEVKFHGGSISQWYPERSGGENLGTIPAALGEVMNGAIPPIDFAKPYEGSASWRIDVLAPGATDEFSTRAQWENPQIPKAFPAIAQWLRARVPGANKVRRGPEIESFIFYRGVGNFPLPVTIKSSDRHLFVRNSGKDPISFLFVYEKSASHPRGVVWWSGAVRAGATETISRAPDASPAAAGPFLSMEFPSALEQAGLTLAEAQALVATWQESYFARDGLRVFWIVPRTFTDSILPIAISPRPEKLERVLVGRSEVLTPAFEAELKRDFTADRGARWRDDRYYAAYLARTQQLGVVLPPVLAFKTSP